ncbi:ABC transporter ATP-binding protein [Streptomyces sp. BA2]|uniref:ABC transporter ATP-binding protein n=1 Tax=Streptomyces sp. BA2 TaxID=436595 RepID=UPI00136CA9F2|nr:ATP-binding cassette domain-containing protein [Streptomyces sp. BA2]
MTVCHFAAVTAGYRVGTPVLSDLSFRLDDGVTLISGPNGTGKSTVVELMAGALRPFTGTVWLDGIAAHDPRLRGRRTVCCSSPALYPALSLAEHVELLRPVRDVDDHELRTRTSAYGLRPWRNTPTGELSTGNLRKAWVVLTTIKPAPFLIFDEPFNGMDPQGVAALLAEFGQWRRQGRAVAVVAHHPPPELDELVTATIQLAGRGPLTGHGGRLSRTVDRNTT